MADTGLLQKVLLHASAFNHSVFVEENLQIFPKATGVVITDRFGISKSCRGDQRWSHSPAITELEFNR